MVPSPRGVHDRGRTDLRGRLPAGPAAAPAAGGPGRAQRLLPRPDAHRRRRGRAVQPQGDQEARPGDPARPAPPRHRGAQGPVVAEVTHLAFELRTNTPDALTADLAERVEESGYRSLWVNHPPDEDGLGHLAKMAAATTRITLGTAVVPISAVPPDAILRRIDETHLPPERLRLGIGSGLGDKPLDRMADAIVYLRERTPADIVVGALGPRMRALGAT